MARRIENSFFSPPVEETHADTHAHNRPHTETHAQAQAQPHAQPQAQPQTPAQPQEQSPVRRSVDLLNNAMITRMNSVRFDVPEEHPLFGDAVERADIEDLDELEERSLTLIEGRRMSIANASVLYQDDQAGRESRRSLAGIVVDADAPAEERSMRDYSIERKSIVERQSIRGSVAEPGIPKTQRLSEYTARVAGHGSILANAALIIENTLSDRHMTTHADNMAWMPIVGESIFRFDASDAARQQASPCLSFKIPNLRNERVDTSSFERKSPAFLPSFAVDGAQQEVIFSVDESKSIGDAFFDTQMAKHAAASWHYILWHWRSGWNGGTHREANIYLEHRCLGLQPEYIVSVPVSSLGFQRNGKRGSLWSACRYKPAM